MMSLLCLTNCLKFSLGDLKLERMTEWMDGWMNAVEDGDNYDDDFTSSSIYLIIFIAAKTK